jgi:hypothetical protein
LGEASLQHTPLLIGQNPGSDSLFAGVLASLYNDRGWRIHKQSIIFSRAAAGSNFSGHLIFFGRIFFDAIPAACR